MFISYIPAIRTYIAIYTSQLTTLTLCNLFETHQFPHSLLYAVILARDVASTTNEFKVLLVKRSSKSSFMPSIYVFPGGAIDPADSSPYWSNVCAPVLPRAPVHKSLLSDKIQQESLAERIATIRETFEETGILAAATNDTSTENSGAAEPAPAPGYFIPKLIGDVAAVRAKVHADGQTFGTDLAARDLAPAVDALHPFARWITPADEKKRYDTYFYILPVDNSVSYDHPALNHLSSTSSSSSTATATAAAEQEVSHPVWLSPADALASSHDHTIGLMPPTVYVLSMLASFSSIPEVLEHCARSHKQGVKPFYPWLAERYLKLRPVAPADATADTNVRAVGPREAVGGGFIALPGDMHHQETAHTNTSVDAETKHQLPSSSTVLPIEHRPLLPLCGKVARLVSPLSHQPISSTPSSSTSTSPNRRYHRVVMRPTKDWLSWDVVVSDASMLKNSAEITVASKL